MKDFETAVRFFPKVTFIFGHAGGVGYEEAVRLGKKYEIFILRQAGSLFCN
jgi:predicted TIM-barrel fold metal-dependent hydrolase